MKTLFFATAICMSGIALAQGTTNQDMNTSATQGTNNQAMDMQRTTPPTGADPDGTDPNGPGVPPGDGITQQGTDPEGRASPPMGTNQMPMGPGMAVPSPNQQAAFTPRPAMTEYPPCSRTVTDNCIQTYERGVRRSRPRR